MRYAVVKNNIVENVIVAKEENKEEMETLLDFLKEFTATKQRLNKKRNFEK